MVCKRSRPVDKITSLRLSKTLIEQFSSFFSFFTLPVHRELLRLPVCLPFSEHTPWNSQSGGEEVLPVPNQVEGFTSISRYDL